MATKTKTKTKTKSSPKGVDATRLLKQDHQKVKGLFEAFEAGSDRMTAKKQKLFEQIYEELSVHAKVEEEIFYPAVDALRSKDAKRVVREANEEHTLAKLLLKQLRGGNLPDEIFNAKMKVLKDMVEHHIKEEEGEMFKEAKDGMETDALKSLGSQLQMRKDALLAAGIETLEDDVELENMEVSALEADDDDVIDVENESNNSGNRRYEDRAAH